MKQPSYKSIVQYWFYVININSGGKLEKVGGCGFAN